jgi:hypothetical protein
VREVCRNQWSLLITPDEIRAACGVLESMNWIHRQKAVSGEQGGRPPEVYLMNPKIVGTDNKPPQRSCQF